MEQTTDKAVQEVQQLKLDSPVVVRKVPMTARGCDLLRTLREDYSDSYTEKRGTKVEIPFPTTIHLALEELVKMKGLKVESK